MSTTETNQLQVVFEDQLVGVIHLDNKSKINFQYSNNWLQSPKSFAVSHSLPLSTSTYTDKAQIYFSNLLPEGKIRRLLSAKLGISEENDFQLLKSLGEDCAGAFQILRGKFNVRKSHEKPEYEKISISKIAKIYNEQPIFYMGLDNENIRLSLAGAQDKIAVYYAQEEFYLPKNGAPSTHILKLPSRDFANLAENEFYMSLLAKDCDLNMMPAKLVTTEKFSGLLIERYDRFEVSKKIHRLHQEDFCQALGVSYNNKYQDEGGPSLVDAFNLLQDESIQAIEDIQQLLRWTFFNICIGNCDNHGKNLALLMKSQNQWQLSPFYDLVCTKIYPSLTKKQAMKIGGSYDGGSLSYKNWQLLMKEINYNYSKFVNEIALPIVDAIQIGLDEHLELFKKHPKQTFLHQIKKEILSLTKKAEKSLKA